MPTEAIDTPALVVDLEAYERNLDRMAASLRGHPVRLRPHAKTHKCPVVARHQMGRGAVGVCCQKVSEAEAMVYGGVPNVLVTNQIVGPSKIARLLSLAKQADVAVCVDDPENVRQLDEAARAFGVRLPVLVEVNIGMNRCGVEPGEPVADLARRVAATTGLEFRGLQAYHGRAQHIQDADKRREVMDEALARVRRTVECLGESGLACEVVTGAGTGTYQFESASGLYTELQPGSYIFMDVDYKRVAGFPSRFENALFVLATVMSRPVKDRAVVDAGLKALAVDSGLPAVHGRADMEFVRASDEHGMLVPRDPETRLRVGDRLWLIPGHCDPTINLYDWYVCVRAGRVDALWPITARGAVL
ncbi:MAG: DSD1 family PLP-dependent enzyme [Candidatus Rokuibacteriota bacterium]